MTKTVSEHSAGGVVYKKDNNLILWLVVKHKGPGHWGFPKGHIGDTIMDEPMQAAALREVKEEGGVIAQIISTQPIVTNYFFQRGLVLHHKTVHYFLMEYQSGDANNHDHEVEEAKFVNEENLLKTLTHKNDRGAFERAKEILGSQSSLAVW